MRPGIERSTRRLLINRHAICYKTQRLREFIHFANNKLLISLYIIRITVARCTYTVWTIKTLCRLYVLRSAVCSDRKIVVTGTSLVSVTSGCYSSNTFKVTELTIRLSGYNCFCSLYRRYTVYTHKHIHYWFEFNLKLYDAVRHWYQRREFSKHR